MGRKVTDGQPAFLAGHDDKSFSRHKKIGISMIGRVSLAKRRGSPSISLHQAESKVEHSGKNTNLF